MRPPRYRFPDHVRSTTRVIAARMIREGAIAQSPEELEAWISRESEIEMSLEQGGYHTAFTAHDLFPLLEVFIVQAEGAAPSHAAPRSAVSTGASKRPWLALGFLLVLAIVLLLLAWASAVAS